MIHVGVSMTRNVAAGKIFKQTGVARHWVYAMSSKRYSQLTSWVAKPHLHMSVPCVAKLRTPLTLHWTRSYLYLNQSSMICNGHNNEYTCMSVLEVCKSWTKTLEESGIPEPAISVELIVAHALGKKMLHEVPDSETVNERTANYIAEMCLKRLQRWPVQYIIKEWDFHDLTLKMRPPVFIPRTETEELAGYVYGSVKDSDNLHFLEIGCGSGAISLFLLHKLPKAVGIAVDRNTAACNLTKENADLCGLSDRINIFNLDFTSDDAVRKLKQCGPFDVIVINPPYIESGEIPQLEPEIHRYEDSLALDGGPDGMDFIRVILQRVPDLLSAKGQLWLEVGLRQPSVIAEITDQESNSRLIYTATEKDFTGRDRFCNLSVR